eukprot:1802729-Prymnesium_polylepis.2
MPDSNEAAGLLPPVRPVPRASIACAVRTERPICAPLVWSGPAAASASPPAETSPSSLHWCSGPGMTGCSPACRCAGLASTSAFFGRRPSASPPQHVPRARVHCARLWVSGCLALLVIADGSRTPCF